MKLKEKWQQHKAKLSRDRQVLTRGPRDNRSRVNGQELLLFALCNWIEQSGVLDKQHDAPETDLLVMAIHDWKESLKNGH